MIGYKKKGRDEAYQNRIHLCTHVRVQLLNLLELGRFESMCLQQLLSLCSKKRNLICMVACKIALQVLQFVYSSESC